jgi:hypothetical protein
VRKQDRQKEEVGDGEASIVVRGGLNACFTVVVEEEVRRCGVVAGERRVSGDDVDGNSNDRDVAAAARGAACAPDEGSRAGVSLEAPSPRSSLCRSAFVVDGGGEPWPVALASRPSL